MQLLQTLDVSGTILSFFSTFFYVKASKWAWPIGIVATVNDGILYGLTGIYGDMTLQIIYFVSMFYGWYWWAYGGKNQGELEVGRVRWRVAFRLMAFAFLAVMLVSHCLVQYTDSQVPYWDAITMVLSLAAQWLTCKKRIECWIVWFAVDAIYVGLYFYKGIPFHSGLSLLYLGMAVSGYWYWRRLLNEQGKASQDLTPG